MNTYSLEVVSGEVVKYFTFEAQDRDDLTLKINAFRQKLKNTINERTGQKYCFPVKDTAGNTIVKGNVFFKSLRKI